MSSSAAPRTAVPRSATAPVCAPAVAPASTTDLSAMFSAVPGWSAADGGFTVRHPSDGSALFVYGDSAVTTATGERRMPHGSALAWRGSTISRASGDSSWIPDRVDGSWYWPGLPVVEGGKLYVFAGRHTTVEGGWTNLGTELAAFSWPACSRPVFLGTSPVPSSTSGVTWGAGVVASRGQLYVYGQRSPHGWGRDVYVARVPQGSLAKASAWRYWTGTSWSTSQSGVAVVLGNDDNGPEDEFTVALSGGRFALVSKSGGPYGTWATRWTAAAPTGPWTATPLFSSPFEDWDQRYLEKAHYDLPRVGGQVLVSTSHGPGCRPDASDAACQLDAGGNRVAATLADLWEQPQWFRNDFRTVDG